MACRNFLFFFSIILFPCARLRFAWTGGRTRMGSPKSSSESCTPQTGRTQQAKPAGYSQAKLPKLLFVLTPSDGTSSFIRLKTPILSDVIFRLSRNSHFATTGMFPMSRQPANYPYAASCKSTLLIISSLNNSPLISIARIIISSFLHTATIAIFLRPVWPPLTRS